MELRVVGWRCEGIRGGIRDVRIEIDQSARWTLIQMPNGTGKTTTMTLLRAAFTGASLRPEEVDELRPDDDAEKGLFELTLDIDAKPFRIQLDLDFVARKGTYSTTSSRITGGGTNEGWLLPPLLRRLLTPEFTKLFVFDGEFARDIRAVGKDRTTTAIKTLYRLDQLDVLNRSVDELITEERDRAASLTKAKEQRGLSRLQNDVERAETCLAALQTHLTGLKKERDVATARYAVLKAKIDKQVAEDHQAEAKRRELDKHINALDTSIQALTSKTLTALRSPPHVNPMLLDRLRTLGNRLTHLQLPKTISKEFFRELAQRSHCVCATPIGETEKQAILDGASQFLAEDQILVINRMKGAIRDSVATGREFLDQAAELKTKQREHRSFVQELELLLADSIAAGGDEAKALKNEMVTIEKRLPAIADKIECLDTTDKTRQMILQLEWDDNIPLCKAELKLRRTKLDMLTRTNEFVAAADKVRGLIAEVGKRSLEKLRESLRVATNQKLERLVHAERLSVVHIGTSLELKSETVASKSGVSEGQSLSVAYAFITSLLAEAPYRLPFIVDSPAVSLDTKVRREVGEVIPELFDQMIMFVISSEKDGFAESFYSRSDARFLTIYRDGERGTQVEQGLEPFKAFHSADVASEIEAVA